MKNIWVILLVVAVVIIGGYFLLKGASAPTPNAPVETTSEVMEKTVLLSTQNESGQSGTAVLTEQNGQVVVTLTTTGFEEDVEQPAHIHLGTCPIVGQVLYGLTNVVNGVSVTTLDVTLDKLASEQPLGVNVHESTDNPQNYVACGDLVL